MKCRKCGKECKDAGFGYCKECIEGDKGMKDIKHKLGVE